MSSSPIRDQTAAGTQIDRRVEGREIGRQEREYDDAEKSAVLGVYAPRHVQGDLVRDAAGHRPADEDALIPAIEMDAEVLAVADVDRLRCRVEGGRDKPAVGPYDCPLYRRARQQRDVARPRIDIELAVRGPHALGDDLHRAGDAIEIWVTSSAKATARLWPSDRARSIAASLAAVIEAMTIAHIARMTMMPTATISIVMARAWRRGSLGKGMTKLPSSEEDGPSRHSEVKILLIPMRPAAAASVVGGLHAATAAR